MVKKASFGSQPSSTLTGSQQETDFDLRPTVTVGRARLFGYIAALVIYVSCAVLTLYETKGHPADAQYWYLFAAGMLVSFFVVEPLYGALVLLYHWMVSQGHEEEGSIP